MSKSCVMNAEISDEARKCAELIFVSAKVLKELHQSELEQRIQRTCEAYHEAKSKELKEALSWALQEATVERDWGTAEWEQYHKANNLARGLKDASDNQELKESVSRMMRGARG